MFDALNLVYFYLFILFGNVGAMGLRSNIHVLSICNPNSTVQII